MVRQFGARIKALEPHKRAFALDAVVTLLIRSKRWDELTALLTDVEYIEAKAQAGLVDGLLADYEMARNSLPNARAEALRWRRSKDR
jgi:hypothetical protein